MKKPLLFIYVMLAVAWMAHAKKFTVTMTSADQFSPATLTINKGDTVVWQNNDTKIHTTTSGNNNCTKSGLWDSGNLSGGQTFMRAFPNAGTIPYFCSIHCAAGMVGSITVNDVQVNGTMDPFSNMKLKTFPNPFVESMDIEFELSKPGTVRVEITDMQGKVVYRREESADAGTQNYKVHAAGLSEGLFVCRIIVDEVQAASGYLVKSNK